MRGQLSNQASQPFISASQWDESALYAQTSLRANEHLGGTVSSVLCIDESSPAKKGKASVGVARQWNGLLGKEDDCQTGVYSALTCGPHVCLAGARLYLPQEWIEDPDRCRRTGLGKGTLPRSIMRGNSPVKRC